MKNGGYYMTNLYDLTDELMQLQAMMEDDDIDPDVLNDTMEAVAGEYELKLESYCKIIKNLEGDIEAIKNEVDRLNAKKKVLDNNIKRLKDAMFNSMKTTDTPKVKGQLFTIAIQKNGGKAPVVLDVEDTSELPDELVKIKEEPNLDAIRELLDSVGSCKYAHYGERGESLRIK